MVDADDNDDSDRDDDGDKGNLLTNESHPSASTGSSRTVILFSPNENQVFDLLPKVHSSSKFWAIETQEIFQEFGSETVD